LFPVIWPRITLYPYNYRTSEMSLASAMQGNSSDCDVTTWYAKNLTRDFLRNNFTK